MNIIVRPCWLPDQARDPQLVWRDWYLCNILPCPKGPGPHGAAAPDYGTANAAEARASPRQGAVP